MWIWDTNAIFITYSQNQIKNVNTFSTAPRKGTNIRISQFKLFEKEYKYYEIISTIAMTIVYSD